MLHVMLAWVYVFLTSLTLLVQLAGPELSLLGVGLLTLVVAWRRASEEAEETHELRATH